MVHLRNLKLPEFDKNRIISEQKALIFDNKCRYDIILGSNFLTKIGLDIKYSTGEMEWYDNTLPMREPWKIDNREFLAMADSYAVQTEDEETFGPDWLDNYAAEAILDAKYEKLDIDDVIAKQDHLNDMQRSQLRALFERH